MPRGVLSLDRMCGWLFVASLALMVPSVTLVKFADELVPAVLGCLALLDCIVNGAWRRYTLLWLMMGIMTFYAVYSLVSVRFNVPLAIAVDWVIELKPWVAFAVPFAVAGRLDAPQQKSIKVISVVNAALAAIFLLLPGPVMKAVMGNIAVCGSVIIISVACYAFTCGGRLRAFPEIAVVVAMLAAGMMCTRAKYYGEVIIALFLLLLYARRYFADMSARRIAVLALLPVVVLLAGWHKINYYFISGNGAANRLDPEVLESFARPVLYATGAQVIVDYVPFGSGLASFASYPSAEPYSQLYYQYGINNVYGLSPDAPVFVCDAFYPGLAQFGLAGIVLFAIFWGWVCVRLWRVGRDVSRLAAACGWTIVAFLLIESVASTTLTQNIGMAAMMFLGYVCAMTPEISALPDKRTCDDDYEEK